MTLSRSSVEPFLQSSTRRDLREKVYKAFIARGDNGNANDNSAVIVEILKLREESAKHARLSDLRRLPAGGFDGQDAGGRARPAGAGLEAGARPRDGRPRRHAGADRGGGRQFRVRRLGLAVLRREAAAAPRQFRRRGDQALSHPRQHDRGRLRQRAPACSASRSPSARTSRSGIPDVRVWQVKGRTAATRRCSTATISRGPRSVPAPG